MRPAPSAEVSAWFERQADTTFFVCAITRAEIFLGIALLPTGQRRDRLATAAEQMFVEDFAGRCLPFDDGCATEYALLVAARVRSGRPISTEDAQIAAVALLHGLSLATRNVKDFAGIRGLTVVNPWS
ncbi:MAG: type II toxin-antitoxin system VapC family toxin [Gammaproteobacteria bacterium]|nr:type II toxin-antitoxin system VapC family toxin [Gammaproteobacteria bacterium]MBU1647136.1 type II toxin-antitoxin system VapC family toxin [Gammaproteobacteria bacterium]MBU1972648.1 type II toxin-antitoxin system VapC family toxin [Gammaproteobacteria bacterium]